MGEDRRLQRHAGISFIMATREGNPLSCPSAPPSLVLFHHAHHRLQRSAALLSKRSYISPHLSIPLSVSTIWRSLGHHRVSSLRKFETWQSLGHHWCEAHEVDIVVPQSSTGVAATWANNAVASAKPGSAWAGGLQWVCASAEATASQKQAPVVSSAYCPKSMARTCMLRSWRARVS